MQYSIDKPLITNNMYIKKHNKKVGRILFDYNEILLQLYYCKIFAIKDNGSYN